MRVTGILLGLVVLALGPATAVGQSVRLEAVQQLLDSGQPEVALGQLNAFLRQDPENAEAVLLQSTALFMVGDEEGGRQKLDQALRLDPRLRQAWLNRGALAIADESLTEALEAFRQAESLDPTALDNNLNIGVVLLMLQDVPQAATRLRKYIEESEYSGESYRIVASNYALAGLHDAALDHLEIAVQRDEKQRLHMRTDPNFDALSTSEDFLLLLETDSFQIPANSHQTARSFPAVYGAGRGRLLPAVVDALQLAGERFDPRVEVATQWALVWADVRIKVADAPEGGGIVALSAPAAAFSPEGFAQRAEEIFRRIAIHLAR